MCECVYHGCCYWCQNTAALCLSCSLGHWETVVMETGGLLCLFPCHTDGKATLHDRHELDGVCGPEETDWLLYSLLYPVVGVIEQQCVEPRPWAGWGLWSRSSWRQGGIQHTHISISPAECLGRNMNMFSASSSTQQTASSWGEHNSEMNGEWRRVLISQRWLTACSMDSADRAGPVSLNHVHTWRYGLGGNCRIIHICCINRLPGICYCFVIYVAMWRYRLLLRLYEYLSKHVCCQCVVNVHCPFKSLCLSIMSSKPYL